jgi:hypothetical protein
MAAYQYYKKEDETFPEAAKLKIAEVDARTMLEYLCQAKGIPTCEFRVNQRGRSSWYFHSKKEIAIIPSMMTVLTLAHEWAHYAYHLDFLNSDLKSASYRSTYRAHGPEHAAFTAWAVNSLLSKFFSKHFPEAASTPAPTMTHDSSLEVARQKFIDNLPLYSACTKCGSQKTTMLNFGVRLMNRPAVVQKGAAPIFRVQAQCRQCRCQKD